MRGCDMIKIQNNRITVHWHGHVYAETLTGYTRDGVAIAMVQLPLQVRFLMVLQNSGESDI